MEITEETYGKIRHILPVQRGGVTVENVTFINALLYVCENGCKWRRLPKEYGKWHVIYKRFNRWVKAGIIERLFRELRANGIAQTAPPALMLDSMTVPARPDACGALKKRRAVDRPLQGRADLQDPHDGLGRADSRRIHPQRRAEPRRAAGPAPDGNGGPP